MHAHPQHLSHMGGPTAGSALTHSVSVNNHLYNSFNIVCLSNTKIKHIEHVTWIECQIHIMASALARDD